MIGKALSHLLIIVMAGSFSIIPLATVLLGFIGVFSEEEINQFSTLNVASLFVFNIL
jgi:hypothetical protein